MRHRNGFDGGMGRFYVVLGSKGFRQLGRCVKMGFGECPAGGLSGAAVGRHVCDGCRQERA